MATAVTGALLAGGLALAGLAGAAATAGPAVRPDTITTVAGAVLLADFHNFLIRSIAP